MSELEKLKLNDEFNSYYDYEAVIRKEKNSEYASGRDDGLAEGLTKGKSLGLAEGEKTGANKEKMAIAKSLLKTKMPKKEISKHTGLSIKQLNMIL